MRVTRVITNRTCNQNCSFCTARRTTEDRAFVATRAVRERITAAAKPGRELVLTGGEPAMRLDLAELVVHARASGAEQITLETNGALIDDALARGIADAGVGHVRVHLPGWGDALDEVTRDPGGFAATRRGLDALAAAGISLSASTPVVAATRDTLPDLPAALATSGLPFTELVLGVPVTSPAPDQLLALDDAARVIEATEARAREVGVALRMSPDAMIPPCLFSRPSRMAHLYSLTPGGRVRDGYRQLDGCSSCVAADRCPGMPEAALDRMMVTPHPISEDRTRRRLSVISSVDAQVARELEQDDVYRREGGISVPAKIVRINFHCNQACRFCFVSTHLPKASDAAVERAILEVARQNGVLVLSGGEPLLNPRVVEYVQLGKAHGAAEVELQTNAIRLGEGDLAARLAAAGVDQCFISLHGSCAEISDAVTEAPGTFDKTVRGIDAALAAGIRTRINFVFCQKNHRDFPRYVEMVAGRWPGAAIVVSFVAGSTDVVPLTSDLIPRYDQVLPFLAEGVRRAAELGVEVTGFESMCGIPLCLVPSDLTPYFDLAEIDEGFDRGEFVYADPCTRCGLRGRCFGIRRGYVELHGIEELTPVSAPDLREA